MNSASQSASGGTRSPVSHLPPLQGALSIPAAAAFGRPELHDNQVTKVCPMLPLSLPKDPVRGSPSLWDGPPSRPSLASLAGAVNAAKPVCEGAWPGDCSLHEPVLVYCLSPEPQQDAKMSEWEHKPLRLICSLRWTWQVGGRSWWM